MKTNAALLWSSPGKFEVVEVDLERPNDFEVLVEMVASGLCHSDDHVASGDCPVPTMPFNGGHEGAGIVREVGRAVRGLKVGDHVLTSFIPECGRCRWCASGMPNLCDRGSEMLTGTMPSDGTFRMFVNGTPVAKAGALGTFAEHQVYDEASLVKIRDDVNLKSAALVACGIPTGWGSSKNAAQVQPGDVVLVIGIGGVGSGAVQGARHCGASRIIAVDTNPGKESIALQIGATDFRTDISEATDLARALTNGQGADSAVITVGIITSEVIGAAFSAIRKAGTVVVTAQGNMASTGIPVNLVELSMYQKRIQGVLYGMGSPRREIQRLLDLYAEGRLLLDELITKRYKLADINQGYADMRSGLNVRGLIDYDL
jgi:S-(hydroxymethyl)glutathione dehydrogenase/alcohol dehydrogenase